MMCSGAYVLNQLSDAEVRLPNELCCKFPADEAQIHVLPYIVDVCETAASKRRRSKFKQTITSSSGEKIGQRE